MKWSSPLFSDVRKKLGSTVYARNRAGTYGRAWVIPANPRTAAQVAMRSVFGSITSSWAALTQPQRNAWINLAELVSLEDSLGQSYHPSGQQLYTGCNVNLYYIGQSPLTDAPLLSRPPAFVPIVSATLTSAAGSLTAFTVTLAAPDATFPALATIFAGQPQKPTINFQGPCQFVRVRGAVAQTPDGADLTSAYAAQYAVPTTGQRVFLRYRAIDPLTGFASPWARFVATCNA